MPITWPELEIAVGWLVRPSGPSMSTMPPAAVHEKEWRGSVPATCELPAT